MTLYASENVVADLDSAITNKPDEVSRGVIFGFFLSLLLATTVCRVDSRALDRSIVVGKERLQLVFDAGNGSLIGINDLKTGGRFIVDDVTHEGIWRLRLVARGDTLVIDPQLAGRFSYRFSTLDSNRVILVWTDFKLKTLNSLAVDVSIVLTDSETLSNWKISVSGFGDFVLDRIWFPRIGNIPPLKNERLVVPQWMGILAKHPQKVFSENSAKRALKWSYPGEISAQCISVYIDKGPGLYLACNDTLGYMKSFILTDNETGEISYEVENLPGRDLVRKKSYELPYEGVIGTFTGDWFTAAEIYRKWATSQIWCRDSRFHRGIVPNWLLKTGIWVWNRGRSNLVLKPATVLQDKLGLPVSVFWHWWHGCAYDAGFPEYFPPREGSRSFLNALSKAHNDGLHAILYMNQRLWGMTTRSWTSENAARYAVKSSDGKIMPHVYNVFTGQPMASMCIATSFWRSIYAGLAAKGINQYGADGIYMDQACTSLICYDSTHDHTVGGGNYWINGFDSLTAQIRERKNSSGDVLLAGEGCGENWLPYLDLFLTLQVSRERYAPPNDGWEVVPFFQAVYHPYAITYGNYSSLVYPPYDELWPKKFRPAQTGKLLSRRFARQFYLEQARAFVWGMQPTIANFSPAQLATRRAETTYLLRIARTRYKALKYLLFGTMEKPPEIKVHSIIVPFSRVSIYAGQEGEKQSFEKDAPEVLAAAWKAKDGSIAFPIASITDTEKYVSLHFSARDYGLPAAGNIYLVRGNTRKFLESYNDGSVSVNLHLSPLDIVIVEVLSRQ